MKPFMNEDFLLTTDVARSLYHDFAEDMPIYDFHCHLEPRDIWENAQFDNIGSLMLGGDHYKWRAMLSNGVDRSAIYPGADDWTRFLAYAATLKYAIGNPLYHWTHLELRRAFGIDDILTERSAKSVWDRANAKLRGGDFRPRSLIEKFGVRALCTT
ncbi:MAG: glucuronate isomerase, partial [Clostridiales bacterium]|nr:glucuronate isomerase [Clostridiales bacterium]